MYDKKVGDRDKLVKKWESLTNDDRKNIIEHIPKYKSVQPDKKYRKDPQTFLNNKSWLDELVGFEEQKSAIYKNDDFEVYKKRQQELGKTLN